MPRPAVVAPVQGDVGAAAQRWVVAVIVALATLSITTAAADPINIPKFTMLLLGVVVLLAVSVLRAGALRRVAVPDGPAVWALAAFVTAAVVVTALAQARGIALWGDYRRNIGLLLYLACAGVFLVSTRVLDLRSVRKLAIGIAAVAVVVAIYALLQTAGVDPVSWANPYNDAIGTLGNPDFAGGYLGITVPLVVYAALNRMLPMWARAVAAVAAVLVVVAMWQTGAWQGRLAAVAGLGVLLLGWIRTRPPRVSRVGTVLWSVAAVTGAVAVVAGIARHGPLALLGNKGTMEVRRHYWDAALAMFHQHPVTGVGLSMYGDHYRAYRSQAAVVALSPSGYSDMPHSVPLAMLANGGLLLALSYVAFVGTVLWALVRAFRRCSGDDALLVGAVGGAWAAYQTQSAVSIDVVSLATLHFVLAATLVVLGGPLRFRTWQLGAAPRRSSLQTVRLVDAGGIVISAVVVVGLLATWFFIRPLRADLASGAAQKAQARGDYTAALSDAKRATSLAGWQPVYWIDEAGVLAAGRRYADAQAAARRALDADARNSDAVVGLAKLAAGVGDKDAARRWYRRALELDPRNGLLKAALADLDKPKPAS